MSKPNIADRLAECWFRESDKETAMDAIRSLNEMIAALQMAKHIVANEGTKEQVDQIFAALEAAGVEP